MKTRYIVFRDAGQGGMWMYLYASSADAIEKMFPEFYVFRESPKRFNEAARVWAERFTSDIDKPTGWLKEYIENEQRNNYVFKNPTAKKPFVDR